MTNDELAMECKKKEAEALASASRCDFGSSGRNYFNGKASAYADIWELAAFGERLCPTDYNIQNSIWIAKVNERMEGPL